VDVKVQGGAMSDCTLAGGVSADVKVQGGAMSDCTNSRLFVFGSELGIYSHPVFPSVTAVQDVPL
jgi:hypothetical protein